MLNNYCKTYKSFTKTDVELILETDLGNGTMLMTSWFFDTDYEPGHSLTPETLYYSRPVFQTAWIYSPHVPSGSFDICLPQNLEETLEQEAYEYLEKHYWEIINAV